VIRQMSKGYGRTGRALYVNYFIHGIQTVVLAQGVPFFAARWSVQEAEVFGVIAAIGIGKIIVMLFAGVLSDLLGRKPFIISGIIGYVVFFGGLLLCTDLGLAYSLAVLAGAATSLLDGGTYPALCEIYPTHASRASLIVKGFIAAATALVPLAAAFLIQQQLSYNWLVGFAFALSVISLIVMTPKKFPPQQGSDEHVEPDDVTVDMRRPQFAIDGLLCLVFGFLCLGTFYLWQQSIGRFAMEVVQMDELAARSLSTVFSLSTIVSVILTARLLRKGMKDTKVLVVYSFAASVILCVGAMFPVPPILYAVAIIVGFTMAGGLLQLGGAILNQFFPAHKGRNTSLYNVCFASATYIVPMLLKTLINRQALDKMLVIMFCFAAGAFFVAFLIVARHRRHIGVKTVCSSDLNDSIKAS